MFVPHMPNRYVSSDTGSAAVAASSTSASVCISVSAAASVCTSVSSAIAGAALSAMPAAIIPTSIILTLFAFIVLSPFSLFFHLQCLQPRTDQLTVHLRIRRIMKKSLFCHLYFLLKLFRQIQHKSPAFCLHHSSLPPAIGSLIR